MAEMVNFKSVAAVFVVLTVVFGAAATYFYAYPTVSTRTIVSTQTVASTVSAAMSPSNTVSIAYKSGIGFYLTNGTGFTLYFRSTDKPYSGTTTCTTATCEKNWPVFYKSSLNLPPGLNASAFGVVTVYNSTQVVTYDGYPLFYWVHDTKPGDTTGQGIGSFYVATVPAPTTSVTTSTSAGTVTTTQVQTVFRTTNFTATSTVTSTATTSSGFTVTIAYKTGIGFYLADGSGRTLYFLTTDIRSNGTSTCTGGCVQTWPVFYTASLILPPGLNASSFTVVTRADGEQQIDYNGSPLYIFSGDTAPGDTFGEGIGGVWFAYSLPTPSQLTTSTTTSSTTTSTTVTSSTTSSTTTTSTTSTRTYS